jgi:hypothetical protein
MLRLFFASVALACACCFAVLASAQIVPPQNPFPPANQPPPANPFPPAGSQPAPRPAPGIQPAAPAQPQVWGAIAFTADGSYATAWKYSNKAEAEASVAKRCSGFGRGRCEVIGFPGELCVALASYRGGRWRIAFPGAGRTYPEAQAAAMEKCKADRRTRANRCQHRTALCGDGR